VKQRKRCVALRDDATRCAAAQSAAERDAAQRRNDTARDSGCPYCVVSAYEREAVRRCWVILEIRFCAPKADMVLLGKLRY